MSYRPTAKRNNEFCAAGHTWSRAPKSACSAAACAAVRDHSQPAGTLRGLIATHDRLGLGVICDEDLEKLCVHPDGELNCMEASRSLAYCVSLYDKSVHSVFSECLTSNCSVSKSMIEGFGFRSVSSTVILSLADSHISCLSSGFACVATEYIRDEHQAGDDAHAQLSWFSKYFCVTAVSFFYAVATGHAHRCLLGY